MVEKLRGAVVRSSLLLFGVVALTCQAEVPGASVIVTPPQPQWTELTAEQKSILAPLSDDWDPMEYHRQKKWLGITRRFSSMTPEEQRRIQAQMQDWGKLTPEQRNIARENFKTTARLPAEKKQELKEKWEQYSSLSPEEKEKLKQQAAGTPVPKPGRIVAGPPPTGMAGASPATAPTPSPPGSALPVLPETPTNTAQPAGPASQTTLSGNPAAPEGDNRH